MNRIKPRKFIQHKRIILLSLKNSNTVRLQSQELALKAYINKRKKCSKTVIMVEKMNGTTVLILDFGF